MDPALESMLSADGAVARALGADFELRPQQARMASLVSENFARRGTHLIEAGTGVGKSFAYLLPAIERIISHGERVVISTHTIALQEQLIARDIPTLQQLFQDPDGNPLFKAELVKGRGNYLSIRRLMMASKRQERLFADAAMKRSLHTIEDWAYHTTEGSLSSLPQLERQAVWGRVQSDSGNCMGRRCPTYESCFFQKARRAMEQADLLVCNHALFFSDLRLRSSGVGFLPQYDHVIFDEAHTIEEVAGDHFGVSLSEGSIRRLLTTLLSPNRTRGYLTALKSGSEPFERLAMRATQLVDEADTATDRFFEQFADEIHRRTGRHTGTIRIGDPSWITNHLTEPLNRLSLTLKQLRDQTDDDEDRFELKAYAERASVLADEAEILCEQQMEGCVYWTEAAPALGGSRLRITVSGTPIDIAPVLAEHLFAQDWSTTLTSATLTTATRGDDTDGFAHTRDTIGCADAPAERLGSPFDYPSQVELFVDPTIPEPRDPAHLDRLATAIADHINATDGGAFVLFTSFATMHTVARLLRQPGGPLTDRPSFVQGLDGSRSLILDNFRQDRRSVLLGTSSFWQGVDVRGDALRNVIITRLPFEPPDRPIVEARGEMLKQRGKNPFMHDALPRAVIRFKQGFGRLIRSARDEGRVVVLDPRIITTRYGAAFLAALPEGIEPRIVESGTTL